MRTTLLPAVFIASVTLASCSKVPPPEFLKEQVHEVIIEDKVNASGFTVEQLISSIQKIATSTTWTKLSEAGWFATFTTADKVAGTKSETKVVFERDPRHGGNIFISRLVVDGTDAGPLAISLMLEERRRAEHIQAPAYISDEQKDANRRSLELVVQRVLANVEAGRPSSIGEDIFNSLDPTTQQELLAKGVKVSGPPVPSSLEEVEKLKKAGAEARKRVRDEMIKAANGKP